MSDIGSSDYSETASSNTAASPNGAPEGHAPSSTNNIQREVMAGTKRFWNRINGTKTGGGSANAQTCNFDVAEAAYVAGSRYMIKLGATNTAAASMNINSLGAVTVKDSSGANDIKPGMLTSGQYAELLYDGTNFRLLDTVGYLGSPLVWRQALASTSTDFDPLPTGFARWDLDIYNCISSTDGAGLDVLVKVSSFQTSNYIGNYNIADSSPTNTPFAMTTASIRLSADVGNTNNRFLDARLTALNVDGTSLPKKIRFDAACTTSGGTHHHRVGWGSYNGGTGAVTGFRIVPTAGTLSGIAVLTGYRFS